MRPDGKSKGLAFVKFGQKSAFNKALEFNETEQFGRPITVEQSQGKPQRNDGGFNNNKGGFNNRNQGGNQGGFNNRNNNRNQGPPA